MDAANLDIAIQGFIEVVVRLFTFSIMGILLIAALLLVVWAVTWFTSD